MPANKDFNRLVRGRMRKTGESHTSARSHLLNTPPSSKRPSSRAKVGLVDRSASMKTGATDFAKLAGMSDAALFKNTGCSWDKWVAALDYAGAVEWPHREIARFVHEKFKIPGWWSQCVTTGYERIKGLRAIGQKRDGGFSATRTRTLAVPISRLYRAFRDTRMRAKWLPNVDLEIRSATREKAMRIAWPDGTMVLVNFLPKGPAKSQVAIEHRTLKDKADAGMRKMFWAERFDALEQQIT